MFFLYPSKYFNKNGLKKSEKHDFRRNGWNSSEDYSYAYEGETGGPRTPGFSVKSSTYYDSLSTCESLKIVLRNKVFVFLTLATSCLYFIITGIQFWVTDYMLTVLKIDQSKAFITFSVICVTAPCIGIMVGGIITHSLGGYHAPGIIKIVCFAGFLSCLFGIPIPFIDSFIIVALLTWLLLFIGGLMMPALAGMIINSAPRGLKEFSNSLAYLCYNCLGYLPSPFLYGIVSNLSGDPQSRVGMMLLMFWTIIGTLFIQLAMIFSVESTEDFPANEAESNIRESLIQKSEQYVTQFKPASNITKFKNIVNHSFDDDGYLHKFANAKTLPIRQQTFQEEVCTHPISNEDGEYNKIGPEFWNKLSMVQLQQTLSPAKRKLTHKIAD